MGTMLVILLADAFCTGAVVGVAMMLLIWEHTNKKTTKEE